MDLILFDVLCRPGTQVRLRARLERADLFRRPVPGRTVIFRQKPLPSRDRPWAADFGEDADQIEVGRAVTDRWGNAELLLRLPQPGHSFFVAECPAEHGEARVIGTGLVACRSTERPAAVLDIDGTLTSEATTLRTGAARAVLKDHHALSAVQQLAEQYDLVYLTGRRRQLVNATRDWLIRQGLPLGPLFAQMSHIPLPGFLSGRWKGRLLSSLRARHPNLIIGIGNTAADAGAYSRNGMVPLIFAEGRPVNAIPVSSWDQVDAMLLGDQLVLPGPVRVLLGDGRAVLELTPDTATRAGSVALRSAAARCPNAPSSAPASPQIAPLTDGDRRDPVATFISEAAWPTRRRALLAQLRGTDYIRTRLVGEAKSPEPPPDLVSGVMSWVRWLRLGSDSVGDGGVRPSGTGSS